MNPEKSITKKDHVTLKTGMLLRLLKIQFCITDIYFILKYKKWRLDAH